MPRKQTKKTSRGASKELVILTGLSGSGKLSALKTFEDLGFYSVDNLPLELVSRIESLDAAAIEHVGGRQVVQYRQNLMPLVPFDSGHLWKEHGKQDVGVGSHIGAS